MIQASTKQKVINDLLEWYRERSKTEPYFEIAYGTGFGEKNTDRVAKVWNPEEYAPESCDALLVSNLNRLGAGTYVIRLKGTGGKTKDFNFIRFQIPVEDGKPEPVQMVGNIGASPEDLKKAVDEALLKYKTDQELIQLRDKVNILEKEKADLEAQVNGPWNTFINALGPFAPQIAQSITGAAKVAGTPQQAIAQEEINPLQERLGYCLQTIQGKFNSEREFVTAMEKLAAMTENPAMWGAMQQFLI